jgi:hypothetical protein
MSTMKLSDVTGDDLGWLGEAKAPLYSKADGSKLKSMPKPKPPMQTTTAAKPPAPASPAMQMGPPAPAAPAPAPAATTALAPAPAASMTATAATAPATSASAAAPAVPFWKRPGYWLAVGGGLAALGLLVMLARRRAAPAPLPAQVEGWYPEAEKPKRKKRRKAKKG